MIVNKSNFCKHIFLIFNFLFGNIINEFFLVLCVKYNITSNNHHFTTHRYKYLFKSFSFSVATLNKLIRNFPISNSKFSLPDSSNVIDPPKCFSSWKFSLSIDNRIKLTKVVGGMKRVISLYSWIQNSIWFFPRDRSIKMSSFENF